MNPHAESSNNNLHNQIKALIHLLSDPNERVASAIRDQLVSIGEPALPYLAEAEIQQPQHADRIVHVIQAIHSSQLEQELQTLVGRAQEEVDLEAGTFLIARLAYPTLDVQHYRQEIDQLAAEVRDRFTPGISSLAAVKILNQYLFQQKGFYGNRRDYYDPDNSFLNRVIDRRTGIPISLSVLYLLIGQRLGLPLTGVGMPGHFLVKLESEQHPTFVDCFSSGALLHEADCARFLSEAGYRFQISYLQTSPNHLILTRILRNLIAIYQKVNEQEKADRLSRFKEIVENQTRQMGR